MDRNKQISGNPESDSLHTKDVPSGIIRILKQSTVGFRVLGLGNAIVDYNLSRIESSILPKDILRGGVQHVAPEEFDSLLRLIAKVLPYEFMQPGGSAANTLRTLAALGWEAFFAGSIGDDEEGVYLQNDLENQNVKPLLYKVPEKTGRFLSVQLSDGNSLFFASPAAALKYPLNEVILQKMNSYDLFHMEAHAALYPGNFVDFIQRIKLNSDSKMSPSLKIPKVSIDLASPSCIRKVGPLFGSIFPVYFDYVFANEEEHMILWPGMSLEKIASIVPDGIEYILKRGENGACVFANRQVYSLPAKVVPAEKYVDSVGAGDIFAAAYLNARFNRIPIPQALELAIILASESIRYRGASFPQFIRSFPDQVSAGSWLSSNLKC